MPCTEAPWSERSEHEVGSVERSGPLDVCLDPDVRGSPRPQDAARQTPLQVECRRVDVVQHQRPVTERIDTVGDGERDAGHVGGSPTDDDDAWAHLGHASSGRERRGPETRARTSGEEHDDG